MPSEMNRSKSAAFRSSNSAISGWPHIRYSNSGFIVRHDSVHLSGAGRGPSQIWCSVLGITVRFNTVGTLQAATEIAGRPRNAHGTAHQQADVWEWNQPREARPRPRARSRTPRHSTSHARSRAAGSGPNGSGRLPLDSPIVRREVFERGTSI